MTLLTEPPVTLPGSPPAVALHRPMPSTGWRGWMGPLAVTVLAGILRLWDLGRPHAIIFDETYYVKDALSLLRFGYERSAVQDADAQILASGGPWDTVGIFQDGASFVVHPPLGKWVIAAGEWALGVDPTGWRVGVAILGTFSVLIVARMIRRLTRSDVVGTVAGLLVALDGIHLVLSRSALLDMTLFFAVVAAFAMLLVDRDAVRRRADSWLTLWDGQAVAVGPGFGLRPWRIGAGVALGAACATKWSGLWFVAAFGVLSVFWDYQARRAMGVQRPATGVLVRDAGPALLSLVGVAGVVYVASWTGWLATDGGYDRQWAAGRGGVLPEALRSLVEYHRAAWAFHVSLDSFHSYQSSAWSWPFMTRPTSFYYDTPQGCGADRCSAEVLALGNPVIWWAGLLALGHNAWRAVAGRDWRSGALLVGYLAGWAPWMLYHDRTIFTFYAVVMLPFLAGMLAISLASLAGGADASPTRRRWGLIGAGCVLVLVVAAAWFFYPIWTGQLLTYEHWDWRMWMPTWV